MRGLVCLNIARLFWDSFLARCEDIADEGAWAILYSFRSREARSSLVDASSSRLMFFFDLVIASIVPYRLLVVVDDGYVFSMWPRALLLGCCRVFYGDDTLIDGGMSAFRSFLSRSRTGVDRMHSPCAACSYCFSACQVRTSG